MAHARSDTNAGLREPAATTHDRAGPVEKAVSVERRAARSSIYPRTNALNLSLVSGSTE